MVSLWVAARSIFYGKRARNIWKYFFFVSIHSPLFAEQTNWQRFKQFFLLLLLLLLIFLLLLLLLMLFVSLYIFNRYSLVHWMLLLLLSKLFSLTFHSCSISLLFELSLAAPTRVHSHGITTLIFFASLVLASSDRIIDKRTYYTCFTSPITIDVQTTDLSS